MPKKVRYLVSRPGAGALLRYFWVPPSGFVTQRIPLDWARFTEPADLLAAAETRAEELNTEMDQQRLFIGARPSRVQVEGHKMDQRPAPRGCPIFGRPLAVYVIGGERYLQKIGITIDPHARLKSLQATSGQPLGILLVASGNSFSPRLVERAAHNRLAEWRREGEWFAVRPSIAIATVAGLIAKRHGAEPEQTDIPT